MAVQTVTLHAVHKATTGPFLFFLLDVNAGSFAWGVTVSTKAVTRTGKVLYYFLLGDLLLKTGVVLLRLMSPDPSSPQKTKNTNLNPASFLSSRPLSLLPVQLSKTLQLTLTLARARQEQKRKAFFCLLLCLFYFFDPF